MLPTAPASALRTRRSSSGQLAQVRRTRSSDARTLGSLVESSDDSAIRITSSAMRSKEVRESDLVTAEESLLSQPMCVPRAGALARLARGFQDGTITVLSSTAPGQEHTAARAWPNATLGPKECAT